MKTINLRSNKELTAYVQTCDRLATAARRLKELEQLEKQLRPGILAEIGERKEVQINQKIRVLTPAVKESISQADSELTVDAFKALGLPINTRTPEYIAPASFAKFVREGLVPEDLISRKEERTIVVT